MSDLLDLAQMESEDTELVPSILPVDARLSIKGDKAKLYELFDRAASITPSKEIILGTSFALLEATEATVDSVASVRITATDGEQTLSILTEGISVAMGGAVLIPTKRVREILKLAYEDTIKLEVLAATATILSGRAQWTVQTPVGDSLPPLANTDDVTMHKVPSAAFLGGLRAARKAVGQVFRPALMQADVADGKITASDGARVHRQKMAGFPESLAFTIPIKVMEEVARALKDYDEEEFELGVDEFHLAFRFGNTTLIANRLLTAYPNVENQLLAPAFANQDSLTVDREELIQVVQRVRVNADPDYQSIYLMLLPGKKDAEGNPTFTMAVRARDPQTNTAQEIMDCQFIGPAKKRELCLNHRYLTDMLEVIASERVIFRLGTDGKTARTPLFTEDSTTGFSGVIQQTRAEWT